jgi:hypothetical protein
MTSDAGLILFTVKVEGAADFEAAMAKFKEGLSKSTKPAYQQMATGWTVQGSGGAEAGQVLYVGMVVRPSRASITIRAASSGNLPDGSNRDQPAARRSRRRQPSISPRSAGCSTGRREPWGAHGISVR